MKTLKTVLASALTAIVLSSTVFTSFAAEFKQPIGAAAAKPEIKKVVITGNTKVFLVQCNDEWVSMDESYLDKVSIKQIGNTLTISSSEELPAVVTVYVKDIFRIDAADKAVVKTAGKFKTKYMQVLLKGDAVARIKTHSESLYTVISDRGNLELMGTTNSHILKACKVAKLKMDKFAALQTERVTHESEMAANDIPDYAPVLAKSEAPGH